MSVNGFSCEGEPVKAGLAAGQEKLWRTGPVAACNTGCVKGKDDSMKKAPLSTLLLLISAPGFAAYPLAKITNQTDYAVSGTVEYPGCSDDDYTVQPGQTWTARSRGVCLITRITGTASGSAKHGESTKIVPYDSTGTSYGNFQIEAYGGQYRIFSDHEFGKVSRSAQGKSPGFRLVNETAWPVAYSLEQVGCLYHDVLPSRFNGRDGVKTFNTGAVWFTLRAHIQPDGINPQTDFDCIEPVAEIVGDVLIGVAETVATGGGAAPAAVGQIVARQVARQALKTAIKVSAKSLSKAMIEKVGEYLTEAGTVTMGGQYAGYEWPFRCDQMPEYHISGGPGLAIDQHGDVYLTPGAPFTVKKTNTCGNDMMPLSPRQATAETRLPFPTLASGTATAQPGPNPVASRVVTGYQDCNYGGYAVSLAPGRYDMGQIQAMGIRNDDLSSIRIPRGMRAQLFADAGFAGSQWNFAADDDCFVNNGANDVVSSIVITGGQ